MPFHKLEARGEAMGANENKSREELLREVQELRGKYATAMHYIRQKINQLLKVMGTAPLRSEELDDATLITLDPIGIISDSFAQVLGHMKETNEELRLNGYSLHEQNDQLAATEEMLRVRINEYETSQKLLKESKIRFDQLAELSNTVIWEMDAQGLVTYISPVCEKVYGFRPDEAIGRIHFYDRFPESERDASKKAVFALFERKESFQNLENNVLTKDGRLIWVSTNGIPLMGVDGTLLGYRGSDIDITVRKNYEKEQLKIDKLESLGVLAGGIAHDFNNVLAGIMGNITLAQMFLDTTHKSYKSLVQAEKASVRATEIAQQLLTFARGGEPVKKVVSLQHLISESVSLVLHGSNVKGVVEIPDSIHAIEVDEGQLSQVFQNIVINATHAMPGGGTLTVTARNETLFPSNIQTLPTGMYVKISFSDQGCGISDADLKKIFDPYFTTKSAGTGLGLASAHSIVSRHGGYIGVSSTVGKGTTFIIHLPSTGETYAKYQTDSARETIGDHKGGFILIMDDEKVIRDMASEMLEYLGYQATMCENGAEAITRYKAARESGTPFSAAIMDLTIPGGMGGKEAAEQILAIDPKACLIVSSGYSNDPIMSDYGSYGFSGAVVKPYKMAEFGKLLSSALSAR